MSRGQVPRGLSDLSNLRSRHLIGATLKADPDGYERIAELLSELHEVSERSSLQAVGVDL
jgi:hypothetical protein